MTATQYLRKGQTIFREGSPSDFAFIIEQGRFEVSRKRLDGKVEVLDILEQNAIFGEMGLLDGHSRSATVTAMENSRVRIISKEDLILILKDNPHAVFPLFKSLSERFRKFSTRDRKVVRDRYSVTASSA